MSKVVSIDKCELSTICLSTNLLRISNSIDTYIYSYLLQKPILYGDNRGLMLGPQNAFSSDLATHLKNASLGVSKDNFKLWADPILMNCQDDKSHDLVNPKEFTRFICPFNNDNSIHLAPKEFIDTIIEKEQIMEQVKQLVKVTNLEETREERKRIQRIQ